jgi:hypothetical protein
MATATCSRKLLDLTENMAGPFWSGRACACACVAPKLGQHNAEIFGRLGVTEAKMEDLRAQGIL